MAEMTHIGPDGRVRMVDVTDKQPTDRVAIASGRIRMSQEALEIALSGGVGKGDPVAVAELAGIMAAKRTADLIPLCHPLPISGCKVEITPTEDGFSVSARVKTTGRTGVEMEALTAVSGACLTLYDMLKAVDKGMVIETIRLEEKSGGASGDFKAAEL
ncbi:MAG: cyclic pyranopterin monophosphate synthase MoaC [Pseudomonadota bacterium]